MPTDPYADPIDAACRRLGVPPFPPAGRLVEMGHLLDEINCGCRAVVTDAGVCSGCGVQVVERLS